MRGHDDFVDLPHPLQKISTGRRCEDRVLHIGHRTNTSTQRRFDHNCCKGPMIGIPAAGEENTWWPAHTGHVTFTNWQWTFLGPYVPTLCGLLSQWVLYALRLFLLLVLFWRPQFSLYTPSLPGCKKSSSNFNSIFLTSSRCCRVAFQSQFLTY